MKKTTHAGGSSLLPAATRLRSRKSSALSRAVVEALEQRQMLTLPVVGIEAISATAAEPSTAGKFRLTRDVTTGTLDVMLIIDGTADSGDDFKAIASKVTFADKSATADIAVTPIDDTTYEGKETVILAIADDDAYTIDEDQADDTVTITDNEKPTVTINASDAAAAEDDTDDTGKFTIARDGPTDGPLVVKFTITSSTALGVATNGTDYETISASATIPDGESDVAVTVTGKDDSTYEGDEAVKIAIATDTAYSVSKTDGVDTVTVTDDELPTVKITAADSKALEGSTTDTGKFTISRDLAVAEDLTVKFSVGGTATDGTDFDTLSTSAVIPAGKTSVDVTLKTKQDTEVELTETATVTLSTDMAYNLDKSKAASVTITDDDKPTVSLVATDATASETGTANTGKFTITRTGATTETLTVPFVITGTATKGTDYKITATPVTIAIGKSTAIVEVKPIDDTDLEGDETVIATLGTGTSFIVNSSKKADTITISEDEVPDVSIVATAPNAAEPSTNGTFTVTRTGPTKAALTVNFAVTGTADSGDDYTDVGTSVVIAAGKSSNTISIATKDDTDLEDPETVIVTLDDDEAYDIDGTADADTVTIKDNEKPTVTLAASDSSAAEEGSATGKFTVTRTGSTFDPLKVTLTWTGTATKGTDYATPDAFATIPAGSKTASITITPTDDSTVEDDETVIGTLAAGATYTVGTDKTGTVTIAENDLPTVTIVATSPNAAEPTTNGTLTVTRNGTTTKALEVAIEVDDASTATADTDYTALADTVTIPVGKLSATITVTTKDDTDLEGKETVIVNLVEDDPYLVGDKDSGTVTINDNEKPTVTITATDDSAIEADEDDGTLSYKFVRTGPTSEALDVFYTLSGFATNGKDITDTLSGKVTIAAGKDNKSITVTTKDDSEVEGDETLILTMKAATTYTIGTDKVATGTITDDDLPTVSIKATDATSKEGSTDGLVLTVTRTGATRAALDVALTASGTAGAGDFAAALPTSATIPAGKSFVTVSIATKDDTDYEGTESLMTLINEDDGYLVDGDNMLAEATVTDNELPTLGIVATDSNADESDLSTGKFTVSRKDGEANTDAVVVTLTITGVAKNGKDYNKIAKTITIPAGDDSKTVTITPKADSAVEGPETVTLALGKGSFNVDSDAKSDTVTIADQQKPEISLEALSTPVDESDTVGAKFRIWRTGRTAGQTLAVKFSLDGSATVSDDYTIQDEDGNDLTDTITIAAGEAYVDIIVVPVDNDTAGSDKTVGMKLSSDSAYTVDTDNDDSTITIADDD